MLAVAADLEFEVTSAGGTPVRGIVRGRDNVLNVQVSDPAAFAGAADAPAIRELAEVLAARGLVVHVQHDSQHLISLGAVRAPWWQRRLTGSRRIRLGSLRGALTAARARTRGVDPLLPDAGLAPPGTLWPPAPTFARRSRRRVSTTHDPARGGGARLVLAKTDAWAGERVPIFWLGEITTIGSDPSCDVVLPGLAGHHASVVHDDQDEFVVRSIEGLTRVHGAPVVEGLLRTGARVEIGPHPLVFYREEYADHGRPFGGRIGGELGRQIPQPPRSAYQSPDGPPADRGDPEA